jgi:von Willebrand factor A domain-containing protein 7
MKTTRSLIIFSLVSASFIAILLFFSERGQAFFPSGSTCVLPGCTQRCVDETHQSITKNAINQFAAENPNIFGACQPSREATEEIIEANKKVDSKEAKDTSAHFDCENFSGGQLRLLGKLLEIKSSLDAGNISGARVALGQTLHAIQDFYSHSNWVETMGGIYPDLGRPAGSLAVAPGATCLNCASADGCNDNLITPYPGWTSGYFAVRILGGCTKPPGKCSHGGCFDVTSGNHPLGGITKDTSNSNHGFLHVTAAAAATEATKTFFMNLQTDAGITPSQIKKLFGCGGTLAMCIDTTSGMSDSGMGDILEAVKNQAIAIVNERLGTAEEPSQYVLAPFNDPGVPAPTVTCDADEFKNAISSLSAHGGGDCPELAVRGIINGLSAASTGGDLFLFTDADAKDADLAQIADDLAMQKQIKIFCSIFGSCDYDADSQRLSPSSPARRQGQAPVASHGVDPVYRQIAESTGGQVFSLDPSEAGQITTLVDDVSRTRAVNLLSIQDTLGPTASVHLVPIDDTMSTATFAVSGGTSVVLIRPDGSIVQNGDPGVTITSLSQAQLFSITNPVTGLWQVRVSGSGAFSITVAGQATLDFESFDFVQDLSDQAHEPGLFQIDGFPIAGQNNIVSAELTDGFSSAQFEFRSPSGAILQVLTLQQGTDNAADVFVGSLTPPNTPFVVYATGHTSSGANFQRLLPGTIMPQSVTVTAPPPVELIPGGSTSYTFQVHNLGSAGTFHIEGTDDKGFLASIMPADLSLNADETKEVTVGLQAAVDAIPGTSDTLSVTATGGSGARNFAVVVTDVRSPNYLILTDASPPDGGTTSGAGTFISGSTVTVNATPNADFEFVNWIENGLVVSTSASYTFTVSSDRALLANFVSLPKTATPTISPPGGNFPHHPKGGEMIRLSCATPGATIYYTKDGSDPTTSSIRYPTGKNYKGFKIKGPAGSTRVVKAIATAPGYNNSDIATASFTFRR